MITLKCKGQNLNSIKLIIFDKDGTIFELYPYWSVIANKRAELICKYAGATYNYARRDHIAYIMGVDNQNARMRQDSMIGINKRSEIENELYVRLTEDKFDITLSDIKKAFVETDAFIEAYEPMGQLVSPVKGFVPFLVAINKKCKCAVLSHDRTLNIIKSLCAVRIESYFAEAIGGEMTYRSKPDPEGAIKIMDNLHIKPENTAFIGDTENDILCGINAQCAYTLLRRSELSHLSISKLTPFNFSDYTEIEVLQ